MKARLFSDPTLLQKSGLLSSQMDVQELNFVCLRQQEEVLKKCIISQIMALFIAFSGTLSPIDFVTSFTYHYQEIINHFKQQQKQQLTLTLCTLRAQKNNAVDLKLQEVDIMMDYHLECLRQSCDWRRQQMLLRKRMSKQSFRGTTCSSRQQPKYSRNRNRLCRIYGIIEAAKRLLRASELSKAHIRLTMEKTPQSEVLDWLGVVKKFSALKSTFCPLLRYSALSLLAILLQQSLWMAWLVLSESNTTISCLFLQAAMTNQCWLSWLTRKMSFSQLGQFSPRSRWLLRKMAVSECVKRQARQFPSPWQLLAPSICFRYSITAEVIVLSSHSPTLSFFSVSKVTTPANSAQNCQILARSRAEGCQHYVISLQQSISFSQQKEDSLQGKFSRIRFSSFSSLPSFWKTWRVFSSNLSIQRCSASWLGSARQYRRMEKMVDCYSLLMFLSNLNSFCLPSNLLAASQYTLILDMSPFLRSKPSCTPCNLLLMMPSTLSHRCSMSLLLSRSFPFMLTPKWLSMNQRFTFLLLFMLSLLLCRDLKNSVLYSSKLFLGCFRMAATSSVF